MYKVIVLNFNLLKHYLYIALLYYLMPFIPYTLCPISYALIFILTLSDRLTYNIRRFIFSILADGLLETNILV